MGSPKAIENWFWGESKHASLYCALRNPFDRVAVDECKDTKNIP